MTYTRTKIIDCKCPIKGNCEATKKFEKDMLVAGIGWAAKLVSELWASRIGCKEYEKKDS